MPEQVLRCLQDPPAGPTENMERDLELARRVWAGQVPPTLRFYGWIGPALTLGRGQSREGLAAALADRRLPWARRPTGGGAVLHDPSELTYSLALRRPLPAAGSLAAPGGRRAGLSEIPQRIHRRLCDLLRREPGLKPAALSLAPARSAGRVSACFLAPVCGDLLYQGKKVGGAALRCCREGLLLQGCLQGLPLPADRLAGLLRQAVGQAIGFEEGSDEPICAAVQSAGH